MNNMSRLRAIFLHTPHTFVVFPHRPNLEVNLLVHGKRDLIATTSARVRTSNHTKGGVCLGAFAPQMIHH